MVAVFTESNRGAQPGGPEGEPPACLPRVSRRDALPEHTHYADTGCDLHPSCLTCPFERCRYDQPGGRHRQTGDRDASILALQRRGVPADAIARATGVSRRTVFRVLARHRQAMGQRMAEG